MTKHEKRKLKAKKLRKQRQDELIMYSRLGGDPQVLREKFYKEDRRLLRNKKKKFLFKFGGIPKLGDINAITCKSKS